MNRRGFLYSLFGTVAAVAVLPKAEFFMMPETAEWQRVVLPFRMMLKNHGKWIQAPAITQSRIMESGQTELTAEPIFADGILHMNISEVMLMDDSGAILLHQPVLDRNRNYFLTAGETLQCSARY